MNAYANAIGRTVNIQIAFKHALPPSAREYVVNVTELIRAAGMELRTTAPEDESRAN